MIVPVPPTLMELASRTEERARRAARVAVRSPIPRRGLLADKLVVLDVRTAYVREGPDAARSELEGAAWHRTRGRANCPADVVELREWAAREIAEALELLAAAEADGSLRRRSADVDPETAKLIAELHAAAREAKIDAYLAREARDAA